MVKVQYDAYNQTFKLVDENFGTLLEGDALCDLGIPLVFEEADQIDTFISGSQTPTAHA